MEDISTAYSLFIDVERSKAFLRDYEKDFMFSELDDDNNQINTNIGGKKDEKMTLD